MIQIKIITNKEMPRMELAVNKWLEDQNGKIKIIDITVGGPATFGAYVTTIVYENSTGVFNG